MVFVQIEIDVQNHHEFWRVFVEDDILGLGGGSIFFLAFPKPWGRWTTHFDKDIFFKGGWFNHPLSKQTFCKTNESNGFAQSRPGFAFTNSIWRLKPGRGHWLNRGWYHRIENLFSEGAWALERRSEDLHVLFCRNVKMLMFVDQVCQYGKRRTKRKVDKFNEQNA